MHMRISSMIFLFCLPLLGQDAIRTESEAQCAPGVKDCGVSQWIWGSHQLSNKVDLIATGRYFWLPKQVNREEFLFGATVHFSRGFINGNVGLTTDPRLITSTVVGLDLGKGWSALGVVDPKWRGSGLATTVFSKGYLGRGPIKFRIDNFHVSGRHAYTYVGLEGIRKLGKHTELFDAWQISLLGPKRSVMQGGIRTTFDNLHLSPTKKKKPRIPL